MRPRTIAIVGGLVAAGIGTYTMLPTPTTQDKILDVVVPASVATQPVVNSPDVNADGVTSIFDLVLVRNNFGRYADCPHCDVNGDSMIDVYDLVIIRNYLNVPGQFAVDGQDVIHFEMEQGNMGSLRRVDYN